MKKNLNAIVEAWAPTIEKLTEGKVTRTSNPEKMAWMAEMAHNHKMHINEAAGEVGGAFFPYQNLSNVQGVGNMTPAQQGGMTAADQMSPRSTGSGDKWPSLLPIALQVAARTIGFDLVHTTPLAGPGGVIPFLDFVYGGGKYAYGATPSRDASTANPNHRVWGENQPWKLYANPSCFRVMVASTDASTLVDKRKVEEKLLAVDSLLLESAGKQLCVRYIGLSRLNANLMFEVIASDDNCNLGELFATGEDVVMSGVEGVDGLVLRNQRPISMLEDQILGYTGAGKYDDSRWSGSWQNPFHLYEPMNRATGEMQYPRQLSLAMKTKWVEVGKIQVSFAVEREQVQDLQKQWGIDVMKMVENQAINELSQTINRHILSRLFALGWLNHVEAYEAEGINLNMNLDETDDEARPIGFATFNGNEELTDDDAEEVIRLMPLNSVKDYGHFENMDTKFARIPKLIETAANLIMQRGRRGNATFAVTNWKIASMLQASAQYTFAPMANTFNQNNGQLYPVGTLAGLTVYVDPMMRTDDTRVLIGRKGDKSEPGVHFCPYIMADSVQFISEGTMAPKAVIQSRYALVNVGWYPETQYLTLFVNAPDDLY